MNYTNEINDYALDLIQRDFYTKKLNEVISSTWDMGYVLSLTEALQQVIDLSSREILSADELDKLEHAILFSRNNLTNVYSTEKYDKVLEQMQGVLDEMHSDEEWEAA